MYTVFKGFAQQAVCNTIQEVKSVLATLSGGAVNVKDTQAGKFIYSAYHFEAGELATGWV